MCLSDWRLGGLITSQISTFSMTTGNFQISANPNRIGLAIRAATWVTPAISQITCEGLTFASLAGSGYVNDIFLTLQEHGNMVRKRFAVTSAAGSLTGSVTEYFLPVEIVAAGIEEFMREYKLRR
jgi:hypothetical protein